MQAFTEPTSSATSSLVGVEPMPLVTYSLTLDPAQGTLFAGTLIDNTGKKATTVAGAIGVLVHDTTTHASEQLGATVYTSGSFLESRIRAANSALTFDAAAIADLRAKNIYLERSIPITIPTPAPAVLEGEQQAESEEERERRAREQQGRGASGISAGPRRLCARHLVVVTS
jgi:hypothetical protein